MVKFRLAAVLAAWLGLAGVAFAQAVPTQTWSLTTSAVTLPGGKSSIVGVDSGISFTPTPNFDLFERNINSNDGSFGFYGGGVSYRLPAVGTKLNNMSPNVNFLRLLFAPTASFGVVRLANGAQHYGFTAGVRADYQLTAGGAWTLGVKGEYAQFPGVPSHAAISLNTAFHFGK
jgi:hypothetical protein